MKLCERIPRTPQNYERHVNTISPKLLTLTLQVIVKPL